MDPINKPLTRSELSEFLPNHRAIVAFENAQRDISEQGDALGAGTFILSAPDTNFPDGKVLAGSDNVAVVDAGDITIDLTDTGVTAHGYGSISKLVGLVIDEKGRISSAQEFDINTSNIVEGGNLFFTSLRALSAFVPSPRININTGTGAIDTVGFSGTVSPVTSITVANGIVIAVS